LANVKIIWINFKGLVPTACRSTPTSATWNNFHETHTIHCAGRIQFLTLQQATGYCETFVLYPTIFFFKLPLLLTSQTYLEFFIDTTLGVGKFKYKEHNKL